MSIAVIDNGEGIAYETLDVTFGTFLSSTKSDATIRIKAQRNKGKGRFSYQCFSSSAEWKTTYSKEQQNRSYRIKMDTYNRSEYETTEPEENNENTGTSVAFPLYCQEDTDQFSVSEMQQKLLEEFAWFLYLNRKKI